MKTYKSIAKRFRVTKRKKIIQKKTGQNHFRSKKRSKYITAKRRKQSAPKVYQKTILKTIKK